MIILCDFDDTAAVQNVGQMLLERFQPDVSQPGVVHWRDVSKRRADGEISLAEYQEISFRQMTATVEEQRAYVRSNAQLRPGFTELAAYCAANGIRLAVTSHGLDYYVRALLDANGVNVESHAVRTHGPAAKTYEYTFADESCAWWPGNCKCKALESCRSDGEHVVYAGDGVSDACPAARADAVFAREPLAGICRERGIAYRELSDFFPVLEYVQAHMQAVR
ncbi:MAG: haloacid dehalogenase-like hydrolase [Chloroflexi bacterium]|nr:haloacid dehalogenase-like hydrolase [Chloroflexota bacterium]